MPPSAARKLDIFLRSAAGLKKVSTSRMAAYAVAWIEPSLRVPSPMDKRHGRNPQWNTTISITLDDRALNQSGHRLHIELLGRGLVSTKPIGFVTVDMTEILSQGSEGRAVRTPFHDYPVRRRSGRQQGILNFELCLQAASTNTATPPMQEEQLPEGAEAVVQRWASSAPPLPQFYQRDSSMRLESQRIERSNSSNKSHRKNSRREHDGHGFPVPIASTKPRAPVLSKQEEICLLRSCD